MRLFFLLLLLQSICFVSYAQDDIDVFYEADSYGNYKFYCSNKYYCNYTIEVFFQEITNLKFRIQNPYKTDVRPGRNFLFTLEVENPNYSSNFNYNYKYFKGCTSPQIDKNFNYLLPVATGKTTEPFKLEYFAINTRDPEPKDFYALGFKVKEGDTIFAVRRGVVCEMRDSTNLRLSGYSYTSDENYIEIFHKDCSFGRYQVLKKSLVRIGQEIEAGDPIAIAGGDKYTSGSHMRFLVYYNDEYEYPIKNNDGTYVKGNLAYVPLVFCTKEGTNTGLIYGIQYTCTKPDSIITQEMTKQQLKNWRKRFPVH